MRIGKTSTWWGFCLALVFATASVAGCNRDPHVAMLKYAKSGDTYMAAGKMAEAIVEYRNALEKDPRAGDVRVKLADAYLRQGDGGNAIEEYVRAADLCLTPTFSSRPAICFCWPGGSTMRRSAPDKALERDPKNVDAQILLANALAGLKDLDGAVAQLEEAITLNPDRSATYTNLGEIELGRGRRRKPKRLSGGPSNCARKSSNAHLALCELSVGGRAIAAAEEQI